MHLITSEMKKANKKLKGHLDVQTQSEVKRYQHDKSLATFTIYHWKEKLTNCQPRFFVCHHRREFVFFYFVFSAMSTCSI